jgi:pimeloyl-ACP methyl ester carboxylesterase
MSLHQPSASADRMLTVRGHSLFTRTLVPQGVAADDRAALVFLHEGLGCVNLWRDFPLALAQATRRPAVLYDRRGYGRSGPLTTPRGIDYLHQEAEIFLPRVLEDLGLGPVILVGHSDGGSIGLLHASRGDSRVAGLITAAAHVFVDDVTLAGIRATVEAYGRRQMESRLARHHGPKARTVFFSWADTWLSAIFAPWNITGVLPGIACPTLVLQGEDDPYGTRAQVEAIVKGIGPAARALFLPRCGHVPHLEARARTLAAMTAFIDQLPPGKPSGATPARTS